MYSFSDADEKSFSNTQTYDVSSAADKGLLERLNNVANSDFARVTYTEAIEILEKKTISLSIRFPGDVIFRQSMNVI